MLFGSLYQLLGIVSLAQQLSCSLAYSFPVMWLHNSLKPEPWCSWTGVVKEHLLESPGGVAGVLPPPSRYDLLPKIFRSS